MPGTVLGQWYAKNDVAGGSLYAPCPAQFLAHSGCSINVEMNVCTDEKIGLKAKVL